MIRFLCFCATIWFGYSLVGTAQVNLESVTRFKAMSGTGSTAADVQVDQEGNIIAAGNYSGFIDPRYGSPIAGNIEGGDHKILAAYGPNDIYLVKYDSAGNYNWGKSIGGPGGASVQKVFIDHQNNIYVTGSASRLVDFDPGPDTAYAEVDGALQYKVRIFLAKYDPSGNFLWVHAIGGNVGWGLGIDLDFTQNGDLIWVGNYGGTIDLDPGPAQQIAVSNGTNYYDIFFCRLSASGQFIWGREIGSGDYDEVTDLVLDVQDNLYFTGYFMQTVDFNPGTGVNSLTAATNQRAFYVASYTGDGIYRWAKSEGISSEGTSLRLEAPGVLRFIGFTGSRFSTNNSLYIGRYQTGSGTLVGPLKITNLPGRYTDMELLPGKAILVVGYSAILDGSEVMRVARVDSAGNTTWQNRFGNATPVADRENRFFTLAMLNPNQFIVAGTNYGSVDLNPDLNDVNNTPNLSRQGSFWVVYQAGSGSFSWVQGVNTETSSSVYPSFTFGKSIGVAIDKSNRRYMAGTFTGYATFDSYSPPDISKSNLSSGFVAAMDSKGNQIWKTLLKSRRSNGSVHVMDVVPDDSGGVYVAGVFQDSCLIQSLTGKIRLGSKGGFDIFLARIGPDGFGLWAFSLGSTDNTSFSQDYPTDLVVRGQNVYLSAFFQQTIDVDPGAGTSNLTAIAQSGAYFVARYSTSGTFQNAGKLETSINQIVVSSDGKLVLGGNLSGTRDFDFGAGVQNYTSSSPTAGYMAAYDSVLNFQWVTQAGASKIQMKSGPNGRIYFTGNYIGALLFRNAGGGNFTTLSGGQNDDNYYLACINSNGQMQWAHGFQLDNYSQFSDLAIDGSGNLVLTGTTAVTVDLDPGAGVSNVVPFTANHPDAFMVCYKADGSLSWIKTEALFGTEYLHAIDIYGDQLVVWAQGSGQDLDYGTEIFPAYQHQIVHYSMPCVFAQVVLSAPSVGRCGTGSVTLTAQVSGGQASWYANPTTSFVLYTGNTFVTTSLTSSRTYYVTVNTPGCTAVRIPVSIKINPIPNVGIAPSPTQICKGTGLLLSGTGAATYSWNHQVQNGVLFFPDSSRTYTVTGTDTNGCTNTSSRLVQVNPLPVVQASVSNDSVCAGSSVVFSGTGAQTYQWTGGVFGNQPFIPTTTSTYILTGISALGCLAKDTIRVVVLPQPILSVIPESAQICQGQSLSLTASGAPQIVWSNGVLNGQPFVPAASGFIQVTATNAEGCSSRDSVLITIHSLPVITGVPSGLSVCSGNPVTFQAAGAPQLIWTGGVQNGQPFVPTSTTTYYLTAISAQNCQSRDTVLVTVNQSPVLTAQPGQATICLGQSLTLSASGAPQIQWTNGIQNGQGFFPQATNSYQAIGIASNGCSDTILVPVVVNSVPVPEIDQNFNTLSCNVLGMSMYEWLDCNQNFAPVQGENGVDFSPGQNGNFAVRIVNQGCADTSACIPFLFTRLENRISQSIQLHPNPVTSVCYLSNLPMAPELDWELWNPSGQVVVRGKCNLVEMKIDFSHLPPGMYGLRYGESVYKIIRQ